MKNIGSKITVIVILVLMGSMYFVMKWYSNERGKQLKIMDADSARLLPSVMDFQGSRSELPVAQTYAVMRVIAEAKILEEPSVADSSDRWHFFGRILIRPIDDAWLVVFRARSKEGFKPRYQLLHRRGNGWSIIGDFDAEPILRKLEILDKLDMNKLQSPESLTPIDQSVPM